MNTDSVSYVTVDSQIEKMKRQGLIVKDPAFAKTSLQIHGYSSIVKSYRDPYVFIDQNGLKRYRDGVAFEQIYSLFRLDQELRSAVFTCMLNIEAYVKNLSSNIIAKDFGTAPDDYLNFRNYRDRSKNQKFSLKSLLGRLREAELSDRDPIRYYREKYGIVPPWILFNGVYFSTITNLIRDFKPAQQAQLAEQMYSVSADFPINEARKLMTDTLFICNEYRNLAAHCGRVYNYTPNASCRYYADESGVSLLLKLLQSLNYQAPYKHLLSVIQSEIDRHCTQYPQDITYLGQILRLNIQRTEDN